MNIWVRRTLNTTLLTTGFVLLGAGIAHAADDTATVHVRLGSPAINAQPIAVHVGLGIAGNTAHAVRVPSVTAGARVRLGAPRAVPQTTGTAPARVHVRLGAARTPVTETQARVRVGLGAAHTPVTVAPAAVRAAVRARVAAPAVVGARGAVHVWVGPAAHAGVARARVGLRALAGVGAVHARVQAGISASPALDAAAIIGTVSTGTVSSVSTGTVSTDATDVHAAISGTVDIGTVDIGTAVTGALDGTVGGLGGAVDVAVETGSTSAGTDGSGTGTDGSGTGSNGGGGTGSDPGINPGSGGSGSGAHPGSGGSGSGAGTSPGDGADVTFTGVTAAATPGHQFAAAATTGAAALPLTSGVGQGGLMLGVLLLLFGLVLTVGARRRAASPVR